MSEIKPSDEIRLQGYQNRLIKAVELNTFWTRGEAIQQLINVCSELIKEVKELYITRENYE